MVVDNGSHMVGKKKTLLIRDGHTVSAPKQKVGIKTCLCGSLQSAVTLSSSKIFKLKST